MKDGARAMTAVLQDKTMATTIEAAQVRSAIESKPVAGGEVTIKLALTPGMMLMLAAPATVLVSMVLGWVLLTSVGLPVFAREMSAGAIVNTVGGMVAALPLFLLMNKGVK